MLERYKIKLEKVIEKYKSVDAENSENLSYYEGKIDTLREIISDLELV